MLDHRIYTFLVLCDEMNYRKTAEKLNMTQPGVTQHIKYLENYYGVKLFEYDGRTLKKTENALRLKRHFDSVRASEASVRQAFEARNTVNISIGATKTIGEFVIPPQIRKFLKLPHHNCQLVIDNTENLLQMLENCEIDFAVIEGVFDKSKYNYRLYKKEKFLGICAKTHEFAGKTVYLEDIFNSDIVVRENGSGTRLLLQQAVADKGFSLQNFKRCVSVSNFSVICELVAKEDFITFAYEPISHCRDDLATFIVEDMQINGEFNFVYCNEETAEEKIALVFSDIVK